MSKTDLAVALIGDGLQITPTTVCTRRQFMVRWLTANGSSWEEAVTAVSYAATRHRDWNMEEQRTFAEWKAALTENREGKAE